jgi:benzoyl-CoA reductase/2-hydroxyglutaryl-CoA dehydratase subunit BcrC/BadD/HgdB
MMGAAQLQIKLMQEYYKGFSKYAKGKPAEGKVAWISAFTPVEILEALDIEYIYPESYAAVIAAGGQEQAPLSESEQQSLSRDCCSYSCCFEGSLSLGEAPRGMPPKPDILIAANNQCNTLPNWWNILALRYDIPLIILDYPGESADGLAAYDYVAAQHKMLIEQLEELGGNKLSEERLTKLLNNSSKSIAAWNRIVELLPKHAFKPGFLFDGIAFLVNSRCKPETALLYTLQADELTASPTADSSLTALFWLGYPLWYHPKRFHADLPDNTHICGSNYVTWWSLNYSGENPLERLYNAYNFTFLNLSHKTKTARLTDCITKSGANGVITLLNKSCKCDLVSARSLGLPQAELEIDMIDREFLNIERAKRSIDQLMEICTV